jgi:peptidoglycan/LPS O-acetylase OafA/YrhL
MMNLRRERRVMIRHQIDGHQKDISLEAIRGCAAVIVVLYHCCVGFLPQHTGLFPQYAALSWQGYPLFFVINGVGAVSLFFVLSGYVLTRRYFMLGDVRLLLRGAVKRWPRLMGPVLVTVLISYGLFGAGLYAFQEAGRASGSPWLVRFANVLESPFHIYLWGALTQGSFLTFFRGDISDYTYDSSLWTMHPELMGSFIVFGMAPIVLAARNVSARVTCFVIGCVALLAHLSIPYLVAFPVGVALAALLPRHKVISKGSAFSMLFLALYLLGYSGRGIGAYAIFKPFDSYEKYHIYPAIAGAAILICLVETFPLLHTLFSGTISRWLGEFSFPIYLIHVLIISSLGSVVYLRYGTLPAIGSVLLATPVAAFPILIFNRRWVAAVNRITEKILKSP